MRLWVRNGSKPTGMEVDSIVLESPEAVEKHILELRRLKMVLWPKEKKTNV